MLQSVESVQDLSPSASSPQRWLVSCDESGVGGETHYGFGALWMREQRRGLFYREFQKLRDAHRYTYECKWQKTNNSRYLDFYKELVEFFFKREWLAFHCFIIKKAAVDKTFHDGDYDLARRKHFTTFLVNKIKACIRANADKVNTFRVWLDPFASRYQKTDETVRIIAERILKSHLGPRNSLEAVTSRDSKETPSIQLCDLLLGAVIQAWNKTSDSEVKAELQAHIAGYLGWADLASDTHQFERKFNIWYFKDKRTSVREVKTRHINLRYPLPERRMNIVRPTK
jgi:hypothetical protein